MSREVPLLASEKIKLGCLVFFILMLIIPGLLGAYKSIYRAIVRNKDAYEKNMQDLCEYYQIGIINEKPDIAYYDISVEANNWNAYNQDQRFTYCDKIYNSIDKTLQVCKMVDKDTKPHIDFYLDSRKVAYIAGGFTHLLD